jgi:sugar/nucleoside kinase (ribokinase family)
MLDRMASPDVLAVGDVMVDARAPSEAVARGHVVGKVRLYAGGSAANAAAWAAAAGARSGVVGRVGDDFAGRALRRELEARGVDARLAVDADLPTGCVLTLGERTLAERGANARLDPGDVPSALEAGAVLVSGYVLLHDDSGAAALAALDRARSAWIAVDAASAHLLERYGRERFLDATGPATVLLLNADEALALTGEEPNEAAQALAGLFRLVCVKRGADGVVACFDGTLRHSDAPPITLVDDSGAGDAFAGALLAALAGGRAVGVALEAACRAGAAAAASHRLWPSFSPRRSKDGTSASAAASPNPADAS